MSEKEIYPSGWATIEQNFPYSDPTTGRTVPNWKAFTQVFIKKLQINQGREFWAAQKLNPELKGIAWTNQYIQGLTEDKEFRLICSRGTFGIQYAFDVREQNSNEIHLRKAN